jgi:rhodanese-related sulfurtransferase
MKRNPLRPGVFTWLVATVAFVAVVAAPGAFAQADRPELPEAKQTSLGLYLTAKEAYEKWQADPEQITVLDVRTTEEYIFVGHAPMARNVPLMTQTYTWNADKERFEMRPNPNFVAQVMEFAGPSDIILVMCRSGGRSARGVNLLAEAGYSKVYQIVDGMEGDSIEDPENVFQGKHLKNGWKNSGNPWTYEIDPRNMRFVTNETTE